MGEIKTKMEKITEDIGTFMTSQAGEVMSNKGAIRTLIEEKNNK
jgi:hypothetical protein